MSLRGQGSWASTQRLAIEGALVQILVLERPWNALLYLVLMTWTAGLFIYCGRFQDWLVGDLKARIENTPR
jgi:hypothetical protein